MELDSTTEQAVDSDGFVPPYISWGSFENTIARMKAEGIPARIDRSYLSTWSGSAQAQFLSAMKSLGLITEMGRPTEALRNYVSADGIARRAILRSILEARYVDVIALGTDATQSQMDEVFRRFKGVSGQTVRKAESFYMNAARAAGIELSTHFKLPRAPSGASAQPRSASSKPQSGAKGRKRKQPPPPGSPGGQEDETPARTGSVREQFVAMLMKKAESQDEMDEALLDRIQAEIDKLEGAGTPPED